MKTVLLTGFEPFLENRVNPTEQLVQQLNGAVINEYEVKGVVLPVSFRQAGPVLINSFKAFKVDAVVMLGVAVGRSRITPERIAINCKDGASDNGGVSYEDESIHEDGEAAYFSSLPIRKITNTLQEEGLPAAISNTAGTYVCNYVMYEMLDYLAKQQMNIPAGFIHVPANQELALTRPELPYMKQQELERAVTISINCLG